MMITSVSVLILMNLALISQLLPYFSPRVGIFFRYANSRLFSQVDKIDAVAGVIQLDLFQRSFLRAVLFTSLVLLPAREVPAPHVPKETKLVTRSCGSRR
jgi:hypothetical protein